MLNTSLYRCPNCEGKRYFTLSNKVRRCEVCKGWGVTTLVRIIAWEASL